MQTRGSRLLGLTFSVAALATTGACFAESPPESLRACAAVRSDHARLVCYDEQMAALGVPRPARQRRQQMHRANLD
jgi:hypothetical protein